MCLLMVLKTAPLAVTNKAKEASSVITSCIVNLQWDAELLDSAVNGSDTYMTKSLGNEKQLHLRI